MQALRNAEIRETIREMMAEYDRTRANWIALFGSDEGHKDWFTTQVLAQEVAR